MPARADDPAQPILTGVDAGATKSVAIAVHPDGTIVGRAEAEGANPKRHGLDVATDRIAAVAVEAARGDDRNRVTADAEPPALLFVAGAGIDRPVHARALEDALRRRLEATRIIVVNDTLAVLRAGTADGVGLVVPVSTGGNVIGRAADGRVTDRGHGIFGGGYVLGALAARAARRGAPLDPALAAAIAAAEIGGAKAGGAKAGGAETAEMPADLAPVAGFAAAGRGALSWQGRRPSPEAARLGAAVVAAAEAGDTYPARMVRRWCGRVEGAVREEADRLDLGDQPVVILYGGLLDTSPWIGEQVRAAVRRALPRARIHDLEHEPAEGAVLLALDAWAGHDIRWDFTPRR